MVISFRGNPQRGGELEMETKKEIDLNELLELEEELSPATGVGGGGIC